MFMLAAFWLALAAGPEEQTQNLVAAIKLVKKGDNLSSEERKANQAAFRKIDTFFNFDRLLSDPIAAHRTKLNSAQLKRYNQAFRELVRLVAYPQASSFMARAEIKYKPIHTSPHHADVPVQTYVAKEDLESNVIFHWEEKNGVWALTDISFDGASLVKDYKNQFSRILEKEGPEGLVKKLESRLQKERTAQNAAL